MKLTNHQKHILRTAYHFKEYYNEDFDLDPITLSVCVISAGNGEGNEYLGLDEVKTQMEDIRNFLTFYHSLHSSYIENRDLNYEK